MKPNLPLTLLGAALLAVPAVFGQATSGVMGFSNVSAPAGTSLVVPTLVNSSVFQGLAAVSSDGLTITPTVAPGWTAGAYAKTSFGAPVPNYPKFYAEIVSGTYEGILIDIDTNSTTALTAISPVVPAAIRGTTVQIAVREHMTLDKVSQGATGFSAYATVVNTYNANGSTSTRYYDGAGWVADDFSSAAGHSVIYPGTGFVVSTPTAVAFSLMGEVKPTKTVVPLYAGTTNVVGALNPASSTLLYNNSLKASLGQFLDVINNYSTDGNLSNAGSYYVGDLGAGAQVLDGSFSPLAPTATDAIPLNRGVIVNVTGDTTWTVTSPLAP